MRFEAFTKLSYSLSGQHRDIDLAPCMILRGPNRSGKTTALRAFTFALDGFPKRGLADFVGENQSIIWCSLEGPLGDFAVDALVVDGKPGFPSRITPALDGSVSDLVNSTSSEDIIHFGSQRMREALIQRFGREVDLEPPALLSETKAALWHTARESCSVSGASIDWLIAMGEWIRSEARATSARARALRDEAKWFGDVGAQTRPCIERCMIEASTSEAKLEHLKRIDDIIAHRITGELHDIAAHAEAAVNEWMPPDIQARLHIDGKDVEWQVVSPSGHISGRSAMSGSERGALSFALNMAWSDGRSYMLLEAERDLAHFDTAHLEGVLSMLARRIGDGRLAQVIIAAPDWFKTSSETWRVVNFTEEAHT